MTQRRLLQRGWGSLMAAGGAALLVTGVSARADTTITTRVVSTGVPLQAGAPGLPADEPAPAAEGAPAGSLQRTLTTCYRGGKARIEDGNGEVILFDPQAGKVYRMDPAQKTYSVTPLKQMLAGSFQAPADSPMAGRMKMHTKVQVTLKTGGEKKTLADWESERYAVAGTVTLRPDFSGGSPGGGPGGSFPSGGHRGGFPGDSPGGRRGGGFPGGGGPGRGEVPAGGSPLSFQVEGEYWLAQGVTISGVSAKDKAALVPTVLQTLPDSPMACALLKPIAERIAKAKGFPLASRVVVTWQQLERPQRPLGESQGSEEPAGARQREPIVITTEVLSITDGTLDDALFRVPDDYRQVDASSRRTSRQLRRED